MKWMFCLFFMALFLTPEAGARTFVVEDMGISLVFPDDWVQGKKDDFGFLILPKMGSNHKIRIHATSYRDMPPEKALQESVIRTNQIRKREKQPLEKLFGSVPIITQAGLQGQKAGIGPEGENARPYLNRYYFAKPDGSIFCVNVYFYGDEDFAGRCEKAIIETMGLRTP